ncbi:hypothetical protein IH981_00135 [Patescibacteria group bacterium]|nr:hypothetical protein [Patescibacteria group bacterium]
MKKLSLLKSLDKIILPLVLLIGARYLGFFLYGLMSSFQFTFSRNFDLASLPFIKYVGESDLLTANSFSWIFTAAVLAFSFGFIAFRNLYLHEDLLHPKQATHLHRSRMDHFIVSSHDAFHQGISWWVVALISLSLALADYLSGAASTIAFGVIISVSASLLALLLLGISKGYKLDSKKV